ncbi:MAG: glycosyltransferase family 39 protein [bacterium]
MSKEQPRVDSNIISKNKFILIILFVYLVLSAFLFDPKISPGGDNAVYMILAESMISGKGYRNLHLPDEPQHAFYPFGFPVILALPVLVFGRNVFILKIFIVLTGIGMVYFLSKITEHLFKDKAKMLLIFCISVPIFIIYNHWIFTETPYLCISLAALYFFIKASSRKKSFYYISFVLATYAVFVRTVGIGLVIGMILILLIKKQFKYAVILALFFLLIFIPWQIRNTSIPQEGGYLEQLLAKHPYDLTSGRAGFSDLTRRIFDNLIYYSFMIIPKTLMPILESGIIFIVVGSFIVLLTLLGLITRFKKIGIVEFYFIFGCVVLLCWPRIWSSERLLLPFLPLFIISFYRGLIWMGKKIRFRYFTYLIIGIFVLLNAISIFKESKRAYKDNIAYLRGDEYAGYQEPWRHYFETIDWIDKNLPTRSVILARKPELVYLKSGRKSLGYPFIPEPAPVKDALKRCDFIIFDNLYKNGMARVWLLPVLEQEPDKYQIIYKTEKLDFFVIKAIK